MSRDSLSLSDARRIALAAQGFADPPHVRPTRRTLARAIERMGVLQIDSVNVLQRSHYLPVHSRLGDYDSALLDQASGRSPRMLVEYWAHVAAFMPVELWPVMRHRMGYFRERGHPWLSQAARPELVRRVLERISADGAATARDLDEGSPRTNENWGWNWSETKEVLEQLFLAGDLAVARRNNAFERVYDLPERVLPRDVLEAPELSAHDAAVELVRRAAVSTGVATTRTLADYYRMRLTPARAAVETLVEAGELRRVRVEGWKGTAYLHAGARVPRSIGACALLSPFDPVVWERDRTEQLFGFRYRIGIYTPAHLREHGYYVLPFLLGERLVARVDLKADRGSRSLLVRGAYGEAEGTPPPGEVAVRLASALTEMARWLGLRRVVVEPVGDLADTLRTAVGDGLTSVG